MITGDVMVVDDDRIFLTLVRRRLRDSGLVLETAGSAVQALAWFREHRVRLLLVDLRMEGTDGLELISTLRAERALEATRVRVVTAAAPGPDVLARIEALGAELLLKEDVLAEDGLRRLVEAS